MQLRSSIKRDVLSMWGGDAIADASEQPAWRTGMRAAAERRAARFERAD